jgi:hypothetical protein
MTINTRLAFGVSVAALLVGLRWPRPLSPRTACNWTRCSGSPCPRDAIFRQSGRKKGAGSRDVDTKDVTSRGDRTPSDVVSKGAMTKGDSANFAKPSAVCVCRREGKVPAFNGPGVHWVGRSVGRANLRTPEFSLRLSRHRAQSRVWSSLPHAQHRNPH